MNIRKKMTGFTIVELLIVIVVVAILASITVVAYNGIQSRAHMSKDVAAATAYANAFKMLYAEVGYAGMPTEDMCLGDASLYPASPPFAANTCDVWISGAQPYPQNWNDSYGGGVMPASTLAPYLKTQPEPSNQIGKASFPEYNRGLGYQQLNPSTWNGRVGRVLWMRNGKHDCPNASYYSSDNTTWCYIYF